jgi:molecular chaperone GrpE (heat shock protein)
VEAKRKNTPSDQERIKELENRLDAAVAESKRTWAEMDELQRRTDLRDFNRLRKRSKLTDSGATHPDETVN